MTATITLPARLDTAAAPALRSDLASASKRDIALNGAAVEHLGGLCVEVLLSARHIWAKGDNRLSVVQASPKLVADLATFGLTVDDVSAGGAT